jgi:homoaconitase/3-isopropylmalate dehydratase large subunit
MRGSITNERIEHIEAKTELINKRIVRANTINQIIRNMPQKVRDKDFKRDMNNIVKGKR